MLWLELQLFPPHLNFTLISTYPCEFASQSPDFSDPTFKKLLDQQSIRLTFSSVLYTSEILFLQSTRSQSKFGLHSLVLQSCPVQREQQLHHRLLLWWALQDKGPPKHLKFTINYGKKGKIHALLSLGPLLSGKRYAASCSLQQWYCWASCCSFLKSTGWSHTPGSLGRSSVSGTNPDREVNAFLNWLSRLSGES